MLNKDEDLKEELKQARNSSCRTIRRAKRACRENSLQGADKEPQSSGSMNISKSLLDNVKLHQVSVMTVVAVIGFVAIVDVGCVIIIAIVAIVIVMADIAVTAVGLVPVVAIMGVQS